MKLTICSFICPALIVATPSVILFQESFENDDIHQVTSYQSSHSFRADTQNYWIRTDGLDINTSASYTNFDGDFFWAAEDLDHNTGDKLDIKTITSHSIAVEKNEVLKVGAAFAVGDQAAFDRDDYIRLQYSEDQVTFQTLIDFRNPNEEFNQNLFLDTDQDGYGDGQALSNSFHSFYALFSPQSEQIWLQIEVHADSEREEVGFDNLVLLTTPIPEPSKTTLFIAVLVLIVVLWRVKMAE